MDETWIERWNERYSKQEFAYGEEPNNYLKEQLEKFIILMKMSWKKQYRTSTKKLNFS